MGTEVQPPTFGSRLAPEVQAQFAYLGIDEIQRTPDLLVGLKNPFVFTGVITDNATTPINLRLTANIPDKRLQASFVAGTDNPDMMLYVESARLRFLPGLEQAADLKSLCDTTYLEHTRGGISSYAPCNGFSELWSPGISQSGGDSTAGIPVVTKLFGGGREELELDDPFLVYFRTDTFQVGINAAVNLAANVPVTLELYGVAWAPSRGRLIERLLADVRAAWRARSRHALMRAARGAARGPVRIPVGNG